jgi:hypothetical protein
MKNYKDGMANYYLSYANKFGGFDDPLPSDCCCVARGEDHFSGGGTKEVIEAITSVSYAII